MLEVASTELKKISEEGKGREPSAKKRLFEVSDGVPQLSGTSFIKAPEHSFRLLCNTITQKPDPSPNAKKPYMSSVVESKKAQPFPRISVNTKKEGVRTIKLSKIAHPITILKPVKLNAPDIQNGSIYKAVKNGDVIHLVKL